MTSHVVGEADLDVIHQVQFRVPWVLRIGSEGDEKAGFKFLMVFDNAKRDGDVQIKLHGLPIVIHQACVKAMTGTQITLGESHGKKGFI